MVELHRSKMKHELTVATWLTFFQTANEGSKLLAPRFVSPEVMIAVRIVVRLRVFVLTLLAVIAATTSAISVGPPNEVFGFLLDTASRARLEHDVSEPS